MKLRRYAREVDPGCFITIVDSSRSWARASGASTSRRRPRSRPRHQAEIDDGPA
ncbi:MAG: hypothetical protein ACLTSX_09140 [Collinsella sp.]